MNKIVLGSLIGTAALMASTGLALAKETVQTQGSESAGIHVNGADIQLGAMTQTHSSIQGGGDADQDGHPETGIGSDENQVHANADLSGTNPMFENKDRSMHATSTRAGEDNGDNGHANDASTSGDNGKGEGFGKGGIRAFFSWIFGLPASTTVGDIRAEIAATTTASASHSEGLGFWARLFGAFHFGGGNN